MSAGVVEVGTPQLFIACAFMLVTGIVSWKMKLHLEKDIVVSTLRAFIQLFMLSFVLSWIFDHQSWLVVTLILFIMTLSATFVSAKRVSKCPKHIHPLIFLSLAMSSWTCTLLVVEFVVRPALWYDARILISICGMVLGNCMSSSALALERTFSGMDEHEDEIQALLACGATPYEAAHGVITSAIHSGMIPTLATLCAVGLVQIPGMMTGQILAGADPFLAAKYQLVVLMAISAANTICNIVVVALCFRKRFSHEGYYIGPSLRDE